MSPTTTCTPTRRAALDRIVDLYHAVAEKCDAVVIVGSDYTDVATPTEFSVNARIAANLGAPVLLVVNGDDRTPDELRTTVEVLHQELKAQHANLFAVVANRCRSGNLPATPRRCRCPGSRATRSPTSRCSTPPPSGS